MGARAGRWRAAGVLGTLLAASLVLPAAPAAAVACGGAAQNGLTITANHDATLYTDFGDGMDAAYVGYEIDNSGGARSDLWVTVGGFTGGSVTLADAAAGLQQISSLPGSGSATVFFHVKATALTSSAQGHTVTVHDRRPDLTGAQALASCDFAFSAVEHTIGANANKVTSIGSTPAAPKVGQTVTVTVEGQTGTTSGAVWVSPAAASTWPSRALRLENTLLEVDVNGNGSVDESYADSLYIPAHIASNYTSQTEYRATYVFRLTRPTTGNPTIMPVAQISSGGQFKHTGSYPALPTVAAAAATASVTVGKTITAGALGALPTTTAPNGVPGATTYAEVPYRIEVTSAGGTSVVDELVDVPATGVLLRAGSATLTDATRTGVALADPVTSTADAGAMAGALHFTGPFTATGATPATVDYTMYVPLTSGSYTNQVFATIAGTTIGASPGVVPTVTVSADGTALTGWSAGTAGSRQAQTITFAQPGDVAVTAGTRSVTASSDSGLAVGFASSTTGVCTVTGTTVTLVSVGTCTITASQAGDAGYLAAASVTRSFAVTKAPQVITFPQPGDVALSAGTTTVAATSDSGLTVAFAAAASGCAASGAAVTTASARSCAAAAAAPSSVCSVSGATVTLLSAGNCRIIASQAGDATYDAATPVSRTFAVTSTSQTITFAQPTDVLVTAGTRTLTATAGSGLAVTFTSSTHGVCTVAGTTVTLVSAGTCTVTAAQAGDATYAAAVPVTRSFQVARAPQVITFPQPPDLLMTGTATPAATSDSGLPVTITSATPEVCRVAGASLQPVSVGTCTITATQTGDDTYLAAVPVTVSLGVRKANQTITFPQPSDVSLAAGTRTVTATSNSGLPVTLDATTPEICAVASGGTVTLLAEGTCTLLARQAGDARHLAAALTRSFAVTPVTGLPSASPVETIGTGRGAQQAVVVVPPGGTVTLVDPGAGGTGTPATSVTVPDQGTYTLDPGTGTISFRPAPGFVGTATPVTYRVTDAEGASAVATYTPTVRAVPAPPSTTAARQGDAVTLEARAPAGSPPLAPATLRLLTAAGLPVTVLRVPGVGTYRTDPDTVAAEFTPAPRFTGRRTVGYRVQDVDGEVLESSFTVTVRPLRITVGRDDIPSGGTAHVPVAGVPAGAEVSVPTRVAGALSAGYASGRVRVVSVPGFSGRIPVPVTVTNGTASVTRAGLVLVRPGPAGGPEHRVLPGGRTLVTWHRSPSAPPRAFRVTLGGRVACRTAAQSCTLPVVAGPRTAIAVIAIGGDDVPSAAVRSRYAPAGCAPVGAVYFDVGSAALDAGSRATLGRLARGLARGGFTRACLVGHTDSSAGGAYNLALSERRVDAVARYLHDRVRDVAFTTSHVGEQDPAESNSTPAGKAANRRVEIGVR